MNKVEFWDRAWDNVNKGEDLCYNIPCRVCPIKSLCEFHGDIEGLEKFLSEDDDLLTAVRRQLTFEIAIQPYKNTETFLTVVKEFVGKPWGVLCDAEKEKFAELISKANEERPLDIDTYIKEVKNVTKLAEDLKDELKKNHADKLKLVIDEDNDLMFEYKGNYIGGIVDRNLVFCDSDCSIRTWEEWLKDECPIDDSEIEYKGRMYRFAIHNNTHLVFYSKGSPILELKTRYIFDSIKDSNIKTDSNGIPYINVG